jgi:hypothetical protein
MGMFKVKSEHPETAGAGDAQGIQDGPDYCTGCFKSRFGMLPGLIGDLSLKSWASGLGVGSKVKVLSLKA